MNPYTIEDILTCKTVDDNALKKDYQKLCEFDALTNPRKFCGNKIQAPRLNNPSNLTKGHQSSIISVLSFVKTPLRADITLRYIGSPGKSDD